jgi:hypothetical protein
VSNSKIKSSDIANALDIVSNTKLLLAELKEGGWESHMEEVEAFCLKHEIDISNMNQRYASFHMFLFFNLTFRYVVTYPLTNLLIKYVDMTKSQNKHDNNIVLHHYKVDVFDAAIDQQLTE